MFDGISELGVIGLVALIVIGPKDLPRLARTVGHVTGKLRRYVADVKSEINREMEIADLKRMQEEMNTAGAALNEQVSALEQDMQRSIAPDPVVPIVTADAGPEPVSEPTVLEPPQVVPVAPAAAVPSVPEHTDEPVVDKNQPDLFGAPPEPKH